MIVIWYMEKLVTLCRILCTTAVFKKQICQLYMQACDLLANPSKNFYYMQSEIGKIQIQVCDPFLIFLLG